MPGSNTALVLLAPGVDQVVDRWRRRYDPVAAFGMPAHVTIVYPWLPLEDITEDDRSALVHLCRTVPSMDLTFAAFGTFAQTLWLDPRPAEPVVDLVDLVVARWGAYRPYGGQFEPVTPHLTLADGRDPTRLSDVLDDLGPRLPLHERVGALSLMRRDSGGWTLDAAFPFAVDEAPSYAGE